MPGIEVLVVDASDEAMFTDGVAPSVVAMRAAVAGWEAASRARRQAEAAEVAAMLAAEAAFRVDFALEFPRHDWFETGLRCFVLDAARISDCGPRSAAHRLRVGHRVHDDLPSVWAMFVAGDVTFAQVQTVAAESEGLDREFLADYDARCAALLASHPGSRLQRKVAEIRERVQARTAVERHREARTERRSSIEPGRDGMAWLHLYGPAEKWVAADQAVHKAAVAAHGVTGETRTLAQLKYDVYEDVILDGLAINAAGIRDGLLRSHPDSPQRGQAVPARRAVTATVVLHVPVLTLLGRSCEPASIDGYGPISPEQAKTLCADAPSFFRVLTHPVTGARLTLDRQSYDPPADLRRWVQLRDEYCRFPGCLRPAHLCDLDHVTEWHDAGVTDDDNLIALSRDHHLLKSMGLYDIEGDPDGPITFVSPMGIRHTSQPRDPAEPAPERLRRPPATEQSDDCPF